ncbi:MAG TPA: HAMP domain-containing sensor histidine kinase [Holophagaceae bacterium]
MFHPSAQKAYVLLVAGFVGLNGAVILTRPRTQAQVWILGVTALFNLLSSALCALRARRVREEAAAWLLLGASQAVAILGNVAFAARHGTLDQWQPHDGWILLPHALGTLLGVLGLAAFPRTYLEPEGRRTRLLGALLFGSSLALSFWLLGLWRAAGKLDHLDENLVVQISLRLSVMGGLLSYQIVEAPRRLRGPLGWLLGGLALGYLPALAALTASRLHPDASIPLVTAGLIAWQATLGLAALHPGPSEGQADLGPRTRAFFQGALYLPYLSAVACFLLAVTRPDRPLFLPSLGFLGVTTLLILHQFALLQDVSRSRQVLDLRVQERTRALMEAQALILRNERMNTLGMMGAGLAHDLNNALGAILSSVGLVRESLAEGQAVRARDLDRIEAAARFSAAMSGRLMAFASRAHELEQPIDLGQLLREDQSLLQLLLPTRIRLEVEITPGTYPLVAARGRLQQVLLNLVANARDAIPAQGVIHLALRAERNANGAAAACLEVTDTGTGMPPEVVEQLFRPLFTTKAPGQGTGLGLACVKTVIEQLSGQVEVQSAPGTGSVFTLRLPLAEG